MKKIYFSFLLTFVIPTIAMDTKLIEFITKIDIATNEISLLPLTQNPSPIFTASINEMKLKQPVDIRKYETAARSKGLDPLLETKLQYQLTLIRAYNKQFDR